MTRRRRRAAPATGRVSTSASITLRRRSSAGLVGDRFLGPRRHHEAERLLLLLGEVGQQAGGAREDRHRLDRRRREAEVEHHRRDRHRDVHRQRLAPRILGRVAQAAARAARADRSPRARRRARGCARRADRAGGGPGGRSPASARRPSRTPSRPLRRHRLGRDARRDPACAASSTRAHASEVPRSTGPAPRIPAATAPWSDPGSAASVMRGDVRGHHPVLRDRHQQQVEEVALVGTRLPPREQQVEVLREAQPAHQVAAEVAATHLHPVRIGLADVADVHAGFHIAFLNPSAAGAPWARPRCGTVRADPARRRAARRRCARHRPPGRRPIRSAHCSGDPIGSASSSSCSTERRSIGARTSPSTRSASRRESVTWSHIVATPFGNAPLPCSARSASPSRNCDGLVL